MATERVQITAERIRFQGKPLPKDSVHELPDWFAVSLLNSRRAVRVPAEASLPEDFPGRAALIAAGFTTVEAVRGIKDFDELKGIGQATEEKIVAYLHNLTEGGSHG